MEDSIGQSITLADFEYEHRFPLGIKVVYELAVWRVVGVNVSRSGVLYYTLERTIVGGQVMRVRAYEDSIKDPNP